MLMTGITQNITESSDAVTLLDGEVVGLTSNTPRSPMAQSHFPSQQQVERDGYDSDSMIQFPPKLDENWLRYELVRR